MSRNLNLSVTLRGKAKTIEINESKSIYDLIASAISQGSPEQYKFKIDGKIIQKEKYSDKLSSIFGNLNDTDLNAKEILIVKDVIGG